MALINKLNAIGDAIREKTGKSDLLTLEQMPVEIAAIETGGGGDEDIPESAFNLTGDCSHLYKDGNWDWFLNKYGKRMKTYGISSTYWMFRYSDVEEIPFDINLAASFNTLAGTFSCCANLKELPKLTIPYKKSIPTGKYSFMAMEDFFNTCYRLREIPDDYFDNIFAEGYAEARKTYKCSGKTRTFDYCFSLRKVPLNVLKYYVNYDNGEYYSCYKSLFSYCHNLDEALNIPVEVLSSYTSNALDTTASGCYRLKDFTFETNEDGTPIVAPWKNQTFKLTYFIGYAHNSTAILDYNSGITADKEVKDDASYQALKNDPDWYTLNKAYSRYNHDSAVRTINSLPDTSATGVNVIQFTGDCGSLTDGGAINTLTEEEIAVAAAKGWTVTLV